MFHVKRDEEAAHSVSHLAQTSPDLAALLAPMTAEGRLEAELRTALACAQQAGAQIRKAWGGAKGVRHKGEIDLVTETDLLCEALIVGALRAAFPADAIVAEEGARSEGESGRTWYIDPLDGTTNFAHGLPHCCVSICLQGEEGPLVGVVYDVFRQWAFYAQRGLGAWREGQRLRVSHTAALGEALVATGFPYDRRHNPDNNIDRAGRILLRAQGLRRAGSAALDLAWLAAGWLDAYWEDRLKPWDLAAGVLLVQEAGGVISDLFGGDFSVHKGRVSASNGPLHAELIETLMGDALALDD